MYIVKLSKNQGTKMIKKLKTLILAAASLFILSAPIVAVVPTYACTNGVGSDCTTQDTINRGLNCGSSLNLTSVNNGVASDCANTQNGSTLQTKISTVINIFSAIIAAVSVIMIIYGGFRYITSGGKQESVSGAKTTILYALIGLVIVALAQVIVQFVLSKSAS